MAKINPIHFKPTWNLVRLGTELSFTEEEKLLMLSDAELITVRVLLGVAVKCLEGVDTPRDKKLRQMAEVVEKKLKILLSCELEERDVELDG